VRRLLFSMTRGGEGSLPEMRHGVAYFLALPQDGQGEGTGLGEISQTGLRYGFFAAKMEHRVFVRNEEVFHGFEP